MIDIQRCFYNSRQKPSGHFVQEKTEGGFKKRFPTKVGARPHRHKFERNLCLHDMQTKVIKFLFTVCSFFAIILYLFISIYLLQLFLNTLSTVRSTDLLIIKTIIVIRILALQLSSKHLLVTTMTQLLNSSVMSIPVQIA